jgi:hypothetical protein
MNCLAEFYAIWRRCSAGLIFYPISKVYFAGKWIFNWRTGEDELWWSLCWFLACECGSQVHFCRSDIVVDDRLGGGDRGFLVYSDCAAILFLHFSALLLPRV